MFCAAVRVTRFVSVAVVKCALACRPHTCSLVSTLFVLTIPFVLPMTVVHGTCPHGGTGAAVLALIEVSKTSDSVGFCDLDEGATSIRPATTPAMNHQIGRMAISKRP